MSMVIVCTPSRSLTACMTGLKIVSSTLICDCSLGSYKEEITARSHESRGFACGQSPGGEHPFSCNDLAKHMGKPDRGSEKGMGSHSCCRSSGLLKVLLELLHCWHMKVGP